jgi:predicted RND superfamily exporter protein
MVFIPRVELRLQGDALISPSARSTARSSSLFPQRDVVAVCIESPHDLTTNRGLQALEELASAIERIDGVFANTALGLTRLPILSSDGGAFGFVHAVDSRGRIDEHEANRLRDLISSLELRDGVLLSSDSRWGAVYAEIAPDCDRRRLLDDFRSLVSRYERSDYRLHLSGNALAQSLLGESVGRDLLLLVPLVLAIIVLVLTASLRSLAMALVVVAEVGVSIVVVGGLIGLTGVPIFVTSLVLPVLLMVIGVSDNVYVLSGYRRKLASTVRVSAHAHESIVTAFATVARPVLLTSATTCIGLLSLAWSDLAPQRAFGIYGALAIAVSTLLTFSLLPAGMVLTGFHRACSARRHAIEPLSNDLTRRLLGSRGVPALVLLACVIAVSASGDLRVRDSWISNLPENSDVVRGSAVFDAHLSGSTPLDLIVDYGTPDAFSEAESLTALAELERALTELETVGSVQSAYTDMLRLQASIDGTSVARIRDARGSDETELLDAESMTMLLLAAPPSLLTSRLDDACQRTRVTVFIRDADSEKVARVVAVADRVRDEHRDVMRSVTPLGDAWISYEAVEALVRDHSRSVPGAMLVELLVLAWAFRSLRLGFLALVPVVVSLILVVGALAACGTSLGVANSMFIPIALGVGIDYSVHFFSACGGSGASRADRLRRAHRAIGASAAPIWGAAGAIALGHSVLLGSVVLPNRQLGLLVAVAVMLAALLTLTLLPRLYVGFRMLDPMP